MFGIVSLANVPVLLADEASTNATSIKSFVSGITNAITSNITLADIATVVASVIAAGIVAMFAWKFARKGFAFVKNALSGKGGKV